MRKRIKLALTIYRDFMQNNCVTFWEEGDGHYKRQTTGALTIASLPLNVISFLLLKGLLTEMVEMALSGEERVRTGAQLPLK